MIASGIKTEEYREIKEYWIKRLKYQYECDIQLQEIETFEKFDLIEFTNGYNPKSPQITLECKGIETGTGKSEWGAVGIQCYFIIKLGKEVSRKNFTKIRIESNR